MSPKLIVRRFLRAQPQKVKMLMRKMFTTLLHWSGFDLLSRQQTLEFLTSYLVTEKPENRVQLPTVENRGGAGTLIFKQHEALTHRAYVWQYKSPGKKAMQLPYGGVSIDSKVLCSDFSLAGFYQSIMNRSKRVHHVGKILIAPWSHYLDGIKYGGYYDYVLLVAAKLCRIKDALSADEFSEAVISYPLFDTAYEQEYMNLLDVKPNQVLDSRTSAVSFERVILGNSGHWFYPNIADILSLKKHVEKKLQPKQTYQKRIYISRSGRRRVVNEEQLIVLLKKFDFTIIEDRPRSVAQQVEIYKNASFILGPHGASFTNIIWCEPGAHLFELFSPSYITEHFLYLAKIMDMKYSAYYYNDNIKKIPVRNSLLEDVYVSIPELEKSLNTIFSEPLLEFSPKTAEQLAQS